MKGGTLVLLCLACTSSQTRSAQSRAKTVQIKKPEIPALVYYAADKLWEGEYGKQGEIAFSDGNTNTALGDVPDNFQSRIACGSDLREIDKPWITDDRIAQQVSPTTCRQLLTQSSIRLKTSSGQQDYIQRDFFPIPATQKWRGKTVEVTAPGLQGTQIKSLSPCCRQSDCPTVCLQNPEPSKCYLEVYTISTGVVYEESIRAELARLITGQSLFTTGGAFLIPRFRVPCDYCPLSNCITNCSNGEYSTGYSDTSVRLLFFTLTVGAMSDLCGCRLVSR